MYVVTNTKPFPVIFSLGQPVVKTEERKILHRDHKTGIENIVIERIERTRMESRYKHVDATLPRTGEVGQVILTREEYEHVSKDKVFQRMSTSTAKGGTGYLSVSVDPSYVRDLVAQREAAAATFVPDLPALEPLPESQAPADEAESAGSSKRKS